MTEQLIRAENGPLDFGLTLRRYHAYGDDAANIFDGKTLRKVLHDKDGLFALSLTERRGAVALSLYPQDATPERLQRAEKVAAHLLGLHFPLDAFYAEVKDDPVLAVACKRFSGMRPTLTADPFEMLVTSISAQQINLAFAFTVRSRLVRQYGEAMEIEGVQYHAFPSPQRMQHVDPAELHALQFTRRKAEYITGIAASMASGKLNFDDTNSASDESLTSRIVAERGLGRWSADWFLARCVGRPTAFPAGDLGVKKAVEKLYFGGEKQPEETIRDFARQWHPYENLAAHYLLAEVYIKDS